MNHVLAFYKFFQVGSPDELRSLVQDRARSLDILGTVLIASEGLNGTVVGAKAQLESLSKFLEGIAGEISFKWSDIKDETDGFLRLKVVVKPEIVSFGVQNLDLAQTGQKVSALEWDELLKDPDLLLIDTRNKYEIDIGTFENSVSPETENFRQFPSWAEANIDPERQKKVAMFCTGGIRCEKASAFLKQMGVSEVFQLDGGILNYFERKDGRSKEAWRGECFVFDQRVSVTKDLKQGRYEQCYACRHPISSEELKSADYEKGVSCPRCIDQVSEQRKSQFRERQKQVSLARSRGYNHIGTQGAKR